MQLWELFIIALSLSMDAFAVSICKGLSVRRIRWWQPLVAGVWFGAFQAVMPSLGYFLGTRFSHLITNIDHWIAFFLLALIGANMIREALSGEEEKEAKSASFGWRTMLPMAVATSIDALAIGVSFAFLQVEILPAVSLIGVITLVLSALGVGVGHLFGARFQSGAEIAGGAALILMGLKILLEHLGVLPF